MSEACGPEQLAALPLFRGLRETDLAWLVRNGTWRALAPGPVYQQGRPAESLFVLLSGEVLRTRTEDGSEHELARTSQPGAYGGAVHAPLDLPLAHEYADSMRATASSRFFVLGAEDFRRLMGAVAPIAVQLLTDQFLEMRSRVAASGQRDRLLALGSLAAGLTHELNNPAAAGVRATSLLRNRVWRTQEKLAAFVAGDYTSEELATVLRLQEEAVRRAARRQRTTPMEAADRYDELVTWFEAFDVSDGWDMAPTFVQADLGTDFFDDVLRQVRAELLEDAVRSLNYAVETELLMREIEESTSRISALVAGAKQYAQLDRAPSQVVDLHDLLDATLLMFADRLEGIDVVKEYDEALPPVPAFPAELNQVWTNLIDNALDAMGESGVLTLVTRSVPGSVVVEVGDDGEGVPDQLRSRIFDPFFTTKPVGESTGLGLDVVARIVVNRHRGEVRVRSRQGETRFVVELPLTASE